MGQGSVLFSNENGHLKILEELDTLYNFNLFKGKHC